jgi:hypothetical protein
MPSEDLLKLSQEEKQYLKAIKRRGVLITQILQGQTEYDSPHERR